MLSLKAARNVMNSAERLMEFNLTRQEATVYLMLIANPMITGYEIAKLTAISRSNAYAALASLTDKGAARLINGSPCRYSAVPIDEFCSNRLRTLDNHKEYLIRNVLPAQETSGGYLTIQGEANIIDTMMEMLRNTKMRVYLSLSGHVLSQIEEQLERLANDGMKVVLITNPPYELKGIKVYHTFKPDGQIRIITDSAIVLTGDLSEGKNSTCLYSNKKNLVDIFKDALQNEIKLIEILGKIPSTSIGE